MITEANFALINTEVQDSINAVFDSIRANQSEAGDLWFLGNSPSSRLSLLLLCLVFFLLLLFA